MAITLEGETFFRAETLVSGGRLFRRSWKVTVGNPDNPQKAFDVSHLDLEFKVLSSIKPEPNKCVLTVWNMNEDHRTQLLKRNKVGKSGSTIRGVPITVEAGYVDNTSVLFSGDSSEVGSRRDDIDWKTTISSEDGGRAWREGRISKQFAAGTTVSTLVQECAKAMGVGSGNVADFKDSVSIPALGHSVPHGFTLSGQAASIMKRLLDSAGLTFSVQKGALQLLNKGKPLNLKSILISPETGLLGSPENSIDASVSLGSPQQFAPGRKPKVPKPPKPTDPSILKLKTLLIPGIVPGRKIELRSTSFNGTYMVTEVETVGQTWGNDYHHNLVARIFKGD